MTLLLGLLASYLLGSIPTSYLVARMARGIDLRDQGSKNLGATNLYRVLGWRFAAPVGLFDLLKGVIPVAIIGPGVGGGEWIPLGCGLAAVLGHVFSVWVRFKGGKGVATGAGIVLAVAPWAFLTGLVVWCLALKASGYVSLASILAAAIYPFAVYLFHPERHETLWLHAGLAALVIALHRPNIQRLWAGTESRFGRRGIPES